MDKEQELKKKKYTADPIKDPNDINRILDYFLFKEQYRNLLLFTLGVNFGLRCRDLVKLKFGHIMNLDGSIKSEVVLEEEKNKNTRLCYMNQFVIDAAKMYVDALINSGYTINLNDYIFTSLSRNNSKKYYDTLSTTISASTGQPLNVKKHINAHIGVDAVEDMLKKVINQELGIDIHAGTHLMRKTFAYQVIMNAPDRNREIEFIQKILGHKSPAATIWYAGILGYNGEINKIKCKIDFNNPVKLNV